MIYLAGYLILFGAALLFVLGLCRAASEPVNQGHPHPDTDQAAVAGVVQVRDSREVSLSSLPAPKTNAASRPSPVLSVNEAARVLGIARATVYRLLAAGELECVRVGKRRKFRPEDLEAYLERGRERAPYMAVNDERPPPTSGPSALRMPGDVGADGPEEGS